MPRVLGVPVVLALSLTAAIADAKPKPGTVGVGAQATLSGPAGAAAIYNAERFHIDAILGFEGQGENATIDMAGRFLWTYHATERSDFGVGGGAGLLRTIRSGGPTLDAESDLYLEAGAEIRAFIVPNVALSMFLGVGVVFEAGQDHRVNVGGQLAAEAGIAYYFD